MTDSQGTGSTDSTDPASTERLDAIDSVDSAERPARSPGWRRGLTASAAALALVAAGALGAAVAGGSDDLDGLGAASSSSESASEPDEDDDRDPGERMKRFKDRFHDRHMLRGPGLRGPGLLGPVFGHGLPGGALHGELVVPDTDGEGYRTLVTQSGEVTAVSATSLTVRSEDGFSATYRLTDDTVFLGDTDGVESVEDGDRVSVSGVRTDGTVRAAHVTDVAELDLFDELRRDRRGGPTPSPGASTGGAAAAA